MAWSRNNIILVVAAAALILHSFFVPRNRDPGPWGEVMLASALVWRTSSGKDPSTLTVSIGLFLAVFAVILDASLLPCKEVFCVFVCVLACALFAFWDRVVSLFK